MIRIKRVLFAGLVCGLTTVSITMIAEGVHNGCGWESFFGGILYTIAMLTLIDTSDYWSYKQ